MQKIIKMELVLLPNHPGLSVNALVQVFISLGQINDSVRMCDAQRRSLSLIFHSPLHKTIAVPFFYFLFFFRTATARVTIAEPLFMPPKRCYFFVLLFFSKG